MWTCTRGAYDSDMAVSWRCFAVVLLAASAARAAGEPISLRDAVARGGERGPGIEVAHAPSAAIDDADHAAGKLLVTPPQLSLMAGPRWNGGVTPELQTMVTVPVHLGDVRGARAGVVQSQRNLVAKDVARAREEAALRAAIAWSRGVEVKEIIRLRRLSLEQAQGLADVAKKRAIAGVSVPSELAMANGDLGVARAALVEAEGQLFEATAELRVALGHAPDAELDPVGDLYAEDPRIHAVGPAWARGAEARNSALQVLTARQGSAKAETSLVAATLAPNLGIGVSYMREGTGDSVLLGVLTLPIPVVDPAAFERARARAEEDRATAQVHRARQELGAQVALSLHEIEHLREVRAMLETNAIPPLREALRLAKVQVDTGTADVAVALLARQRLLAAEETLARSCAEVWRADLKLAYYTGQLREVNR